MSCASSSLPIPLNPATVAVCVSDPSAAKASKAQLRSVDISNRDPRAADPDPEAFGSWGKFALAGETLRWSPFCLDDLFFLPGPRRRRTASYTHASSLRLEQW